MRLKFLFLITMPTSVSVFIKVGLELGLKPLSEMLSGFGTIHRKALQLQRACSAGLVLLELAPASVSEPPPTAVEAARLLLEDQDCACASCPPHTGPHPPGAVGYVSSKAAVPTALPRVECFSTLITDVRLLFKSPLNTVKCFHVKSCDRGMLKPELPPGCGSKPGSAPPKYRPLFIVQADERGRRLG